MLSATANRWATSLFLSFSTVDSKQELDRLVGEFSGVFTNADGNLFAETYNQLNAYFATVPGNYALNLRKLYLLNTQLCRPQLSVHDPAGRKTQRASGRRVSGRAGDGQQHAVLPESA